MEQRWKLFRRSCLLVLGLVLVDQLLSLARSLRQQSCQYNLPEGVTLKKDQQFEYIVVGAGAAGSAVAARLALAGASVLLVEAGGDPDFISWVPFLSLSLQGSTTEWQYETIPNNISCLSFRGGQCQARRGKTLGGSTAINYMIYTRGHPSDWDSLGIPGWTWEDMKPYFLRYEGLKDLNFLPVSSIPYHYTNGTMAVQFFEDSGTPWHSRFIEGYLMLKFPYNPDVNSVSQIGVTQVVGFISDGERMSTARGYLSRSDVKAKLKVAKHTRCTKVIIDESHIAKGVTVVSGRSTLNLYATREVILSAGAIATPQILMLSGVGHSDHLHSLNIPVHADLPVGDEMTDHALPLMLVKVDSGSGIVSTLSENVGSLFQFVRSRVGSWASIGISDINAFVNTLCYDYESRQLRYTSLDCNLPTAQFIHALVPKGLITSSNIFQKSTDLNDDVIEQLAAVNLDHELLVVSPVVLQPKSLGQIRLKSNNPSEQPAIFPNLLSDDRDIEEMLREIRIVEDLMETRPFKKHNASIVKLKLKGCPKFKEDKEGYWRCYVRHMTHTTYHSVGTTGIGRVVDEALRVYGVQGLRVADLGVLPSLVRGNTAASAIAVGERVVDFLLKDQKNHQPKEK